jgi:hypothetical protein
LEKIMHYVNFIRLLVVFVACAFMLGSHPIVSVSSGDSLKLKDQGNASEVYLIGDDGDRRGRHEKMVTIFLHGQGGDRHHGEYYHASRGGPIEGPLMTIDFGDAHDLRATDLGQQNNISTALVAARKARELGFGKICIATESRGAATAINLSSSEEGCKFLTEMGGDVCIIAISPFARSQDAVRNAVPCLASVKHQIPNAALNASMRIALPKHDPNGIQPIDSASLIPRAVPTFYICSTGDGLIPASSTEEVYKAQTKAGHPRAHLLTLENGGPHAGIVYGPKGKVVGDTWHAFLDKYGFPANKKRAADGRHIFERECSPPFEERKSKSSWFASLSSSSS